MKVLAGLFPDPRRYPENRLFCLDALRGLDMVLLTVIGPLFWACDRVWHFPPAVTAQFRHGWECFTFWDIIMPLFIFMCGAAIPFALGLRLDAQGRATRAFWLHVAWRVALLWFLGMLCQGRLATLDAMKISPYNNTLQTIAAGYLVAALVLLVRGRAGRIARVAAPCVLALGYAALLHFCGDYSKEGNFAQIVEQKVLSWICPAGSEAFNTGTYTWFLTTMMFGAMTLCGLNATEILRGAGEKRTKTLKIFAYGVGLLAFGWAVAPVIPMIKPIFTLSFTAQAMGWCVLALGALYALTDVLMLRRGWGFVLLYGQFALWAYMFRGFFGGVPSAFASSVSQGFPHLFGKDAAGILQALVAAGALTAVLVLRRRLGLAQPSGAKVGA